MKVCFILPSLAKKGPNQVAADIINSLLSRGLVEKIDVFYFDNVDGVSIAANANLVKINFFDKIDLSVYDVVHSHMFKPDIFVFTRKLKNFGRKKIKAVTTIHQIDMVNLKYDYNSYMKALIYSLMWRSGLILHDKIVCLSNSMVKYYKNKLFFKSLDCIYNGRDFISVDNSHIHLQSHPDFNFKIGTTCLLTERKGLDQILRVLNSFPNVSFYIAGTGPEEAKLRELAKFYGVSNRVHFIGFVKDTTSFLVQMDAFTLPSRGEGFPLSLLEAASLGLPCIVSDLDVICEAFGDDEVIKFKLDDLESLTSAIEVCLADGKSYGFAVKKRYIESFTSNIMADKYFKLYKSL